MRVVSGQSGWRMKVEVSLMVMQEGKLWLIRRTLSGWVWVRVSGCLGPALGEGWD